MRPRPRARKKVFITFHAPRSAARAWAPSLKLRILTRSIAAYAKDLDIVVFNGHVHTTELYEVDGVKYLVLGGGGAEQDPILPGRTHIKVPAGYPPDMYWKGEGPKEEYNYLLVDVRPGQPTKFTLNRFRPWSARAVRDRRVVQVNLHSALPFRSALPLPNFMLSPLTAFVIAVVHVYLAAGHLTKLIAGEVQWTHIWKGFGALLGAYVFLALASRGLVRHPDQHEE